MVTQQPLSTLTILITSYKKKKSKLGNILHVEHWGDIIQKLALLMLWNPSTDTKSYTLICLVHCKKCFKFKIMLNFNDRYY